MPGIANQRSGPDGMEAAFFWVSAFPFRDYALGAA
jgi:hypothetical protein